MRYRVRCSRKACQARRTLPRHPDSYIRPPRCHCGSTSWRIDRYRMTQEFPELCQCDGYWFPHRPGSGMCRSNPMAPHLRNPDDDELLLRCVNQKLRLLSEHFIGGAEP